MFNYKLSRTNDCILRFSSQHSEYPGIKNGQVWCIPLDPSNRHYQEYLEWVAEGNTPLPADSE